LQPLKIKKVKSTKTENHVKRSTPKPKKLSSLKLNFYKTNL